MTTRAISARASRRWASVTPRRPSSALWETEMPTRTPARLVGPRARASAATGRQSARGGDLKPVIDAGGRGELGEYLELVGTQRRVGMQYEQRLVVFGRRLQPVQHGDRFGG